MSFAEDVAEALLTRTTRRFDKLEERLDEIERILRSIKRLEAEEMATLADVRAKVEEQDTVINSAVTLLEQLSLMLKDAIASNDPQAFQQIADMLDAEKQRLADAVVANTPAAP